MIWWGAWVLFGLLPVHEPGALLPADTGIVTRVNVQEAWKAAESFFPDKQTEAEALRSFRSDTGLDLKKDVFDCLADTLVVGVKINGITSTPTVTVVAPLENARKARATAKKLLSHLGAAGDVKTSTYRGIKTWNVKVSPEENANWAYVRGCLVFSSEMTGIHQVIDVARHKRKTGAEDVAATCRFLPRNATVRMYISPKVLMTMTPPLPGMKNVQSQIKTFDGFAYAVSFQSDRVRLDVVAHYAEGKAGERMRAFTKLGVVSNRAAVFVPGKAIGFVTISDLAGYWRSVHENMAGLSATGMPYLPSQWTQIWQVLDEKPWRTLIQAVDGDAALGWLGFDDAGRAKLLFVGSSRRSGKLQAAVRQFEQSWRETGRPLRKSTESGIAVTTVQSDADRRVSYAFFDDALVMATNPDTIVAAVAAKRGKNAAMLSSAGYQTLLREVPGKHWLVAYLDVPALAKQPLLPNSTGVFPWAQALASVKPCLSVTDNDADSGRSVTIVGAGLKDIVTGFRNAAFAMMTAGGPGSEPAGEAGVLVGKPAPDFALQTLQGKTLRLSSLRGNVVVLDFWATWCPPCRKEIPLLQEFYSAQRAKSVRVLMITDDQPTAVGSYVTQERITMTALLDSDSSVSRKYKVTGIPQLVVIDKQGVVQRVHVGYSPMIRQELGSEVGALLTGASLPRSKERQWSSSASATGNGGTVDPFAQAGKKADEAECQSNLKQLALASLMYAQDHSEHLPDYRTWTDVLFPYVKSHDIFHCPSATGTGKQYQMNSHVSGFALGQVQDPAGTILLFECNAGGRPEYRHNGGMNLAFVDGHVKWLSKGSITPRMWTPSKGD